MADSDPKLDSFPSVLRHILCLAAMDPVFKQKLLKSRDSAPLPDEVEGVVRFPFTEHERQILRSVSETHLSTMISALSETEIKVRLDPTTTSEFDARIARNPMPMMGGAAPDMPPERG
jgi:hypothetical protein